MGAMPTRGSKMENYVANTILAQIKCGQDSHGNSGSHMMMCWAFQNPWGKASDSDEGRGFLEFTVDGALFAGQVKVTLGWDDLYMIEFIETNGNCITVLHEIYFDDLANVIDRNVENPKNV